MFFFRGALLEYLSGDPDGISPTQRRGFVRSFIIHVNLRLVCVRQLQQGIRTDTVPAPEPKDSSLCVWRRSVVRGEACILALVTSGP